MKRFISLTLIFITIVLLLSSCGTKYKTKTAEFYGTMDKSSFWFRMSITDESETYFYTQAVKGNTVTTIEDHTVNSKDEYQIYENGEIVHMLDFSQNVYDSAITTQGVRFMFAKYEAEMFEKAESAGEVIYNGGAFYCETFKTNNGLNKYYFKDNVLSIIEVIIDGKTTTTMFFEGYSNQIPSTVYLSIPEGFTARNLTQETIIDEGKLEDGEEESERPQEERPSRGD